MRRILFVCTGNVFRSVVADALFRKYCTEQDIKDVESGSAGTVAMPERVDPATIRKLEDYGVTIDKHAQKRVSRDLLQRFDIIISMAKRHQKVLKDTYQTESHLFNGVAYGEDTSIKDVDEVLEDPGEDYEGRRKHIEATIDHIWKAMP